MTSKPNTPTLRIFIKGIYFDQIIAGTKNIEYRKVSPFWSSRLLDANNKKRHYDQIEFINGMRSDSRRVITLLAQSSSADMQQRFVRGVSVRCLKDALTSA